MRVRDGYSRLIIPMIWDKRLVGNSKDKVWIFGVNKDILKEYEIRVFDCRQALLYRWIYLVDRAEFESFLAGNNLPILFFSLGC